MEALVVACEEFRIERIGDGFNIEVVSQCFGVFDSELQKLGTYALQERSLFEGDRVDALLGALQPAQVEVAKGLVLPGALAFADVARLDDADAKVVLRESLHPLLQSGITIFVSDTSQEVGELCLRSIREPTHRGIRVAKSVALKLLA